MGLFGKLFGAAPAPSGKRRYRGPGKTPAEREKLEGLRFLRELKENDPAQYNSLMLKRLGLGEKQKDEFEALETMVSRLKRMGLIKSPNELGGDGSIIRDAIAGMGMLLQMNGGLGQRPAAQAQQIAEPEPQAQPQPQQQQEGQVSLASMFVIGQLQSKSPEQAAAWLRAQPYPQAQQLVQMLRTTPDDQIPVLLGQITSYVPDLAGVVDWLRQRPEWLMDTVRVLRTAA